MAASAEHAANPGLFLRVVDFLNPTRRSSRANSKDQRSGSTASGAGEKSAATDLGGNALGSDPEEPQAVVDWELRADNVDRRRWGRTLPPWVHSLEDTECQDTIDPNALLLPRNPSAARYPHHNYMPIPKPRPNGEEQPDLEDGFIPDPTPQRVSRWTAFARASAFPRTDGEIVSEEWMKENLPDFDRPWTPVLPQEDPNQDQRFWLFSPAKRKAAGDHTNRVLMRNPFVPLIVRLVVMTFCATSLALGAWIYRLSRQLNASASARAGTSATANDTNYICEQQTSTYMAFIVNSIAVLYLFYITWDEYFSKPLGLRRTRAKMRLLFLDLLFIVFSAADLSLAFNTLTDQQWSCFVGDPNNLNNNNVQAARSTCVYSSDLCGRQRALVSVLLIAEIAWVLTFAVSVLRVVERIST